MSNVALHRSLPRQAAVHAVASKPVDPFKQELRIAIAQSGRGVAGKPVTAAVSQAARAFMKAQKLFGNMPDGNLYEGVRAQWRAVKEVAVGDKRFVVMARALETKLENTWSAAGSDAQEVLEIRTVNGKPTFRTFEQAVATPKEGLKIGIGSPTVGAKEMYYGHVKGKDAIAALKSIYGASPVEGASFTVAAGAKAAFDPTPGRKWHVTEMHFSLRRGMSAEIYDGRPSQLDEDFPGYFHSTKGKFAPWEFSRVKAVQVDGQWLKALPKKDVYPPFG